MAMHDEPVIVDPLDRDFYMDTMGQLTFVHYPTVEAEYGFTNRTIAVRLAEHVDLGELRENLQHARTLRCDEGHLQFYRSRKIFSEAYLEHRRVTGLPEVHVEARPDGQLRMESRGPVCDVIPWESCALAIANELYFKGLLKKSGHTLDEVEREGMRRLDAKIDKLSAYSTLKIMEFGTRRRFSRRWQRRVLMRLLERIPGQIAGTSNMALAREFGITPLGTMAHALFMLLGALLRSDWDAFRDSQDLVFRLFEEMYGPKMLLALTDTYGTDFFFRRWTKEQAERWLGTRQDSGDPVTYGEEVIRRYEGFGIDPRTKLYVPSDGLDVDKIIALFQRFAHRIGFLPGWGTDLTNDLGFKTLSAVMKALKIFWVDDAGVTQEADTCKLTDNLAKAFGPKDLVAEVSRQVEYPGATYEECIR